MKILAMASTVLLLILGIALPQAYGGIEGKETGLLSGIEGHHAAGKVTITKDEAGKPILTMTDIKVDRVPDGRVYLAIDGNYAKGVELGKLKKFTGAVEFPIPSNVNLEDYDSVVIWCKKFAVGIGIAYFDKE